jgi:hypothetical protein
MKIAKKYSHLNGEEYFIVHHNDLYEEIKEIIHNIDAEKHRTKISKEKNKKGINLLSPKAMNKAFDNEFNKRKWEESRYNYYITLNRELMEQSILLPTSQQKEFLLKNGEKEPIYSYN